MCPDLFASQDKKGLVSLRDLTTVAPGIYKATDDLLLFAHPEFRREGSRSNTMNVELLAVLETLRNRKDVGTLRVRLDPDMVGLAMPMPRSVEREYWYGPKFSDDLTSIPTGVYADVPSESVLDSAVSKTEFWWQSRDGEHIFECEEVRDRPASWNNDRWPCRYAHSIVAEDGGTIEHLDGAVRVWNDEAMLTRCDASLPDVPRNADYIKLWRLDGNIPLGLWEELIYLHFRGNPAISQYFQGSMDVARAEPNEPLAPASEPAQVGDHRLVIKLSLHRDIISEGADVPDVVVRFDSGSAGSPGWGAARRLVERIRADAAEVRVHETQHDGTGQPVFIATSRRSLALVGAVLNAMWGTHQDFMPTEMLALNLGLTTSDGDLRLGIVGDQASVRAWMGRADWFPPEDRDRLANWFEAAREACWGSAPISYHVSAAWNLDC